jgi:hypothetical protein
VIGVGDSTSQEKEKQQNTLTKKRDQSEEGKEVS